jgi:hypothetical protein
LNKEKDFSAHNDFNFVKPQFFSNQVTFFFQFGKTLLKLNIYKKFKFQVDTPIVKTFKFNLIIVSKIIKLIIIQHPIKTNKQTNKTFKSKH